MPKLTKKTPVVYMNLTDAGGNLLLRVDLSEYDLRKPYAQADPLLSDIRRTVEALTKRKIGVNVCSNCDGAGWLSSGIACACNPTCRDRSPTLD